MRGCGSQGFSLLELMIALVLVAILAGIAIPAYQGNVRESYRRQAQADLMAAAQAMERGFMARMTYTGLDDAPPFSTQSPQQGEAVYTLAITDLTSNGYTLTATPLASGPAASDGLLRITSLGQRFWDKNNDGDTSDSGESSWED